MRKTSLVVVLVGLLGAAQCGGPGTLTVHAPSPGGSVVSDPAGIQCPGRCSADFGAGARVRLIATPDATYHFGGWSGGGCEGGSGASCELSAGGEVEARFPRDSMVVEKSGLGTGVVTSEPAGIQCGGTCSQDLPAGTRLKLTAVADPRSVWIGWSGSCSGTGPCDVTVGDKGEVAVAHFAARVCGPAGFCWEAPQPQGHALRQVWGSGPEDVWAVGEFGTILRWDGWAWSAVVSNTKASLAAVSGTGPADVWAVGEMGTIMRWDGKRWASVPSGTGVALTGVWGFPAQAGAPAEVWATGEEGIVLRWNGSAWSRVFGLPQRLTLTDLWGTSPKDIWGVGTYGTILHWDGIGWTRFESTTSKDLVSVWGSAADDVWAAGPSGALLHYEGQRWVVLELEAQGVRFNLTRLWGTAADDMWLIGWDTQTGRAIARHWDGSRFSAVTTDRLAPLFGVFAGAGPREGGQRPGVWLAGAGGALGHISDLSLTTLNAGVVPARMTAVAAGDQGVGWAVGTGGAILRLEAGGVTPEASGVSRDLLGVLAGPKGRWAFGKEGVLLRHDGTAWASMASGVPGDLYAGWIAPGGDLWAVGVTGVVLHVQGTTVTQLNSETIRDLYGIWGSSGSDIWAAGERGELIHYDGTSWSLVASGVMDRLYKIWGTARDNVWIGDSGGRLLHYDGKTWSIVHLDSADSVISLWGTSASDIWAVAGSAVLHYDGKLWTTRDSGVGVGLFGIAGSAGLLWAVGDEGAVLRQRP